MKSAYLGIFLAVSTLFIMPLSVPIFNHLVVVMTPDSSVDRAADVMKQEIPDAIVVEYGSLEFGMIAHRAYGGVTWISHGSEDNVKLGTDRADWKDMVALVRTTPSKDVVLACHSSEMDEYIDNDEVVTFPGLVDSVLGALFVSSIVTRSPDTIENFFEYGMALVDWRESLDPLYLIGRLSPEEGIYWLAISTLTLASILFNYFTDFGTWKTLGYILVSSGKTGIIVTLVWLRKGWIDPLSAVAKIVSFILGTMIGALIQIVSQNIFAYIIFMTCVIATLSMWGASAGTIATAQLVLAIAAGIAFLVGLALDFDDADTYVG